MNQGRAPPRGQLNIAHYSPGGANPQMSCSELGSHASYKPTCHKNVVHLAKQLTSYCPKKCFEPTPLQGALQQEGKRDTPTQGHKPYILYQACGDITTPSLVKSNYMISSTENLYKIYERPVVVIIITCSCSDELDENNRLPPSLADEGQHSTNHEKS